MKTIKIIMLIIFSTASLIITGMSANIILQDYLISKNSQTDIVELDPELTMLLPENQIDASIYDSKYLDTKSFILSYNNDVLYSVTFEDLLEDFENIDGHITTSHGETAYDFSDMTTNYFGYSHEELISNDFPISYFEDYTYNNHGYDLELPKEVDRDKVIKYIVDGSILYNTVDISNHIDHRESKITSSSDVRFDWLCNPTGIFESSDTLDPCDMTVDENYYYYLSAHRELTTTPYMDWNNVISISIDVYTDNNNYVYSKTYIDDQNNELTYKYILEPFSESDTHVVGQYISSNVLR